MTRTFFLGPLVLLLAGCSTVGHYREPKVNFDRPPLPEAPLISNTALPGAIYNPAAYRPMFETYRARLPGDTLTIAIVERISASQKSTSSVARSGEVKAGVSALGLISPAQLGRGNLGTNSSNTHDGKGATESSNDFSGTITAVVVGVMPNGHLLVTAEKQIGLNANVDILRFTGQVDPRTILPGNTVESTAVANVRLEQRSHGQQGDAQVMGLLTRFFLNVLPI